MDGNDPATESQLNILKQLHYEHENPLTRVEAAQLICDLRRHHEVRPLATGGKVTTQIAEPEGPHLSASVKNARQALGAATISRLGDCERALAAAIRGRQEFWKDTCRELTHMETRSAEARELYMKHGCCFLEPTGGQVQEILDALDSALPDWEQTHAELFYQTLGLNFPELVRHL